MALQVKAKIVYPNNAPYPNLTLNVCFSSVVGIITEVGSGVTNQYGDFVATVELPPSKFLPRIFLRHTNRVLSHTPESYNVNDVNFGTLEYSTTPQLIIGSIYNYSLNKRTSVPSKDRLIAGLTNRVTNLNNYITSLKTEHSQIVDSLNAQIDSLKQTNLSLTNQAKTLNTNNEQLTRSLQETKSELINSQSALETADNNNGSLQQSITTLEKSVTDMKLELESSKPLETDIAQLYDNTAASLEETKKRLRERNSSFVVNKITMNLKVLPGQSGKTVMLPGKEDIKEVGPEALSELKIEFSDLSAGAAQAVTRQDIVITDLIGYTQKMARQKLLKQSLTPIIQEEYVGQGDVAKERNGRVLAQNPPAGTKVKINSPVYLTIGRSG